MFIYAFICNYIVLLCHDLNEMPPLYLIFVIMKPQSISFILPQFCLSEWNALK